MKSNIVVGGLKVWALLVVHLGLLSACAALPLPDASRTVSALRFIGEQRLATQLPFAGTVVGGLSGIDYDPARKEWVMVSDDRSEHDPARYYRARLEFDNLTFSGIQLLSSTSLLQADGSTYPSFKQYAKLGGAVADLESIRVDPSDGSVWYTSEGDVNLGLPPFVRHATADGHFIFELPLPSLFNVDTLHRMGPRDNQSFEGMSFTPDGKALWVSLEGPLYQDGEVPTDASGAVTRLTRFSRSGAVLGQFAYQLDALPATPGKGRHGDNGISEILALSDSRLLVLERAGIQDEQGRFNVYVRIYEVDTSRAIDIHHVPALHGNGTKLLEKRLVTNLNKLKLPHLDNVEGMALGPPLPNGNSSLILISDDNFSARQVTQLLLFEVEP